MAIASRTVEKPSSSLASTLRLHTGTMEQVLYLGGGESPQAGRRLHQAFPQYAPFHESLGDRAASQGASNDI